MSDYPQSRYAAELQARIRQRPVQTVALGFLTGFVLGGGQRTRVGQNLVGFAIRLALRVALSKALVEAIGGNEQSVGI